MANAVTALPENGSIPYEVFWKPLLNHPKINALPFNIYNGKIGKEMYFDKEFDALPTLKTECGWDYKTGTPITKKSLDPAELDFSFKQCYTEFLKSIWGDNLPDGWRKGELTPEIVDRIVTKQSNAFNTNLLYALFFGDKTSTVDFLSGIDGVFVKLLAGVAANDGTVDAGAIVDSDLLPANIEAKMYEIYSAQTDLLKSFDANQKAFIVTQSIYEAWGRYLQINTAVGGNLVDRASVQNGITGLSYQGIPLINANWIDMGIKLFDTAGSPPSVVNPHRVILTMPSNHAIMIDGSGFEAINPEYFRIDDIVYSPASAMIDYQYGYGHLNVIAGF